MLRGGVLGFGGMGQSMTRKLHEAGLAQIVGVCDRDAGKLEMAREKLGLKTTGKPGELCSWDVDFVLVTSTNYAHYEHVLAAAEAGKHMLVEKPPALTMNQMDEMIEAVEKKGLITVVDYGSRFQPACLRMKDMIESGELGTILSITCYSSRGFGLSASGARHPAVMHPAESGGWLVHHACHSVDLAVWLAGEARTAYCRSRTTVPEDDSPEVIWGLMTLQSGALAVIGDTIGTMRQRYITVIGTKATLELIRTPTDNVLHMRRETGREFPYFEDVLGYGTFWPDASLRELVTCIQEKTESPHNLRSTRSSLASSLALEESRRTGNIVALSEVDRSA